MRQPPDFTCPACGVHLIPCDFWERDGCTKWAEYEGWFGEGLMTKLQACPDHIKESRGYEAGGEKALREAKRPEREDLRERLAAAEARAKAMEAVVTAVRERLGQNVTRPWAYAEHDPGMAKIIEAIMALDAEAPKRERGG